MSCQMVLTLTEEGFAAEKWDAAEVAEALAAVATAMAATAAPAARALTMRAGSLRSVCMAGSY